MRPMVCRNAASAFEPIAALLSFRLSRLDGLVCAPSLPVLLAGLLAAAPLTIQVAAANHAQKGTAAMIQSESRRVSDVEFQAAVPAQWRIPNPGEMTKVELELRITNRSDHALRFPLLRSTRVTMRAGQGSPLVSQAGRNGITPEPNHVLSPGESLKISLPAQLLWLDGGHELRLHGADPLGGIWNLDGLKAGSYELSLRYANGEQGSKESVAAWVGSADTSTLEISIRP